MPATALITSPPTRPASPSAYLAAHEKFAQLITQLQAPQSQSMTHSELENLIESEGRELLRCLLQAHLDERSPGAVSEVVRDADGQALTHQRLHLRHLETIFGTVSITRTGYGGRSLQSLHPLDAALNLPPERYSHTVRRRAAELAAGQSFDEVVATLSAMSGAAVPKRQVEQLISRAAGDFAAFYALQRTATAREARASSGILVITCDGKGVPMCRADLRAQTRQAAEQRQPRLAHRRSRGEKSATKRLATVAAVYTIAPFVRRAEEIVSELHPQSATLQRKRPCPEDKRVWASLQQPPEQVILQAFEEAARRDPRREKRWCALVDGNRFQLDLLRLAAADYGVELTIVLDLIHVCEYLWQAAWALHQAGDRQAEAWVSKRLLAILRGQSAQVAAGIRRSATLRGLSEKARAPLDKCADYLLKYRDYLRYDQYLAAGLPIATGVIEGACRYLVRDRMEVTGARWRLSGAEAVLRLRSLRASGDFEEYWQFHLAQEYQRNHTARYANGTVPELQTSARHQRKGAHLRVVK